MRVVPWAEEHAAIMAARAACTGDVRRLRRFDDRYRSGRIDEQNQLGFRPRLWQISRSRKASGAYTLSGFYTDSKSGP